MLDVWENEENTKKKKNYSLNLLDNFSLVFPILFVWHCVHAIYTRLTRFSCSLGIFPINDNSVACVATLVMFSLFKLGQPNSIITSAHFPWMTLLSHSVVSWILPVKLSLLHHCQGKVLRLCMQNLLIIFVLFWSQLECLNQFCQRLTGVEHIIYCLNFF